MGSPKAALVAGGTGGIGEGIVKVLVDAGWVVFVPLRPGDTGEQLKTYCAEKVDSLIFIECDLGIASAVEDLKRALQVKSKILNLVVVAVGSNYYGYSLLRIPEAEWKRLVLENLATHFHLQQVFLNLLREQDEGTYVTLTGPEADFAHPDSGVLSILAAAQKMMARVEALEASDSGIRIYSVTAKTPVATRARGEQSSPDWLQPEDLGRYILRLAEKSDKDVVHILENRDAVRVLLG